MQRKSEKKFCTAIFDRRKTVARTGEGTIEIRIYINPTSTRYIAYGKCTEIEWRSFQHSRELQKEIVKYEHIMHDIYEKGEPMTLEHVNMRLGLIRQNSKERKFYDERTQRLQRYHSSNEGFIDFIRDEVKKEKIAPRTMAKRLMLIDALKRFDGLNRFSEVTPYNIHAFHEFLVNEEVERSTRTIFNYHKILKKFVTLATNYNFLPKNPYNDPLCKFDRGEDAERQPLEEQELQALMLLEGLTKKEEHARDLFIFMAYTGLSYCDTQEFDFKTMTVKVGDNYYIDGERLKNGHIFFTPILDPAMLILQKYDYSVPQISNQKANEYMHLLEPRIKTQKRITCHVARHSFATLVLNNDVPIENLARMMGHHNIRTTQIYGKILKSTVTKHAALLNARVNTALIEPAKPIELKPVPKKALSAPELQPVKKRRGRPRKGEVKSAESPAVVAPEVPKTIVPPMPPEEQPKSENTMFYSGWNCSYTYS